MTGVLIVAASLTFEVVQVESISMEPTLAPDDTLLVLRMPKGNAWLQRLLLRHRQVVVLKDPLERSTYLVKRIVALGGDRVHIDAGTLVLNGVRQSEPYVVQSRALWPLSGSEVPIPRGYYFVLGDNRVVSRDSRDIGMISPRDISGVIAVALRKGSWHIRFLLGSGF
jgi:signal peptidase I